MRTGARLRVYVGVHARLLSEMIVSVLQHGAVGEVVVDEPPTGVFDVAIVSFGHEGDVDARLVISIPSREDGLVLRHADGESSISHESILDIIGRYAASLRA